MKILIADDHALFRDALKLYIENANDKAMVIQARDLHDAMSVLQEEGDVDLVLLDLRMPGMNGLKGIKKIISTYKNTKVALISGVASRAEVDAAMKAGASGFFPKTISGKGMLAGIDDVLSGKTFLPVDHNTEQMMPSYYDDRGLSDNAQAGFEGQENPVKLTRRETDVLRLLMRGASNKNIAEELDLQVVTVKLHIGNLFKKFDVKNRTQVVLKAQQCGYKS